ncbi:LLM class flavin-dependent oxidoreductase [Granulicella cerasi]|uniref:LLM class flavin-dependent oxidoreductase n=1 Tax=Granulicella cerasi TaxID=741063 RepID=A0ABW1ZAK3_9BACT
MSASVAHPAAGSSRPTRSSATAKPSRDDFPQQLAELRAFLDNSRWDNYRDARGPHPFSKIRVMPSAETTPRVWLLGSSMWSSVTAAQEGLPYAFAHFFSGQGTREAITHYQRSFVPSAELQKPEAMIAIGAIVAPTQEEADHLHASVRLLQRRIRQDDRRPVATPEEALRELNVPPAVPRQPWPVLAGAIDQPETEYPRYVVGTPAKVRDELLRIARELELRELIVNTITHSHEARKRSYSLLAEAFEL